MAQRSSVKAKGSIALGKNPGLQVLGGSTLDLSKGLHVAGFNLSSLRPVNRKQEPRKPRPQPRTHSRPQIKKTKLF